MNILQIDSSILGGNSVSRQLTTELAKKIQQDNPGATLIVRDLAAEPVAHLSGTYLGAGHVDPSQHSAELQHDIALSTKVLEEFLAADTVIIGAPMYNFTIPTQLKAWIDRLAVPGKTFQYTAEGPKGLAGDKKIIVVSSRGGFYGADTAMGPLDHQETYLKTIMGFFGITNVDFIRAEGVAISPEQKTKSLDSAKQEIANCNKAA